MLPRRLILSHVVLCHMQRQILAALESINIYVPNAVRPAPNPSPLSVISVSCGIMSNHGYIPFRQLLGHRNPTLGTRLFLIPIQRWLT